MYKKTWLLAASLIVAVSLFTAKDLFGQTEVASDIDQVTSVTVSDVTAKKATISWSAVDNAAVYRLRLLDVDGNTLRTKDTKNNNTSKRLKKLDPETTYGIKVRALVNGEKGDWSDVVEFTTEASTNTAVSIEDFAFTPDTVQIHAGDSVTWTNNDAVTHTVTSDDAAFDSGNIAPGETFALDFQTAGTYTYHCDIHTSMTGTVTVE